MTSLTKIAVLAATTSLPFAAIAQTTPADVLAEWQAQDAAYAFLDISYDVVTDTDDLIRLENFQAEFTLDMTIMTGSFVVESSWVELRANPDGTVQYLQSDTMTMRENFTGEMMGETTRTTGTTTLRYEGLDTVISGTPGAHTYTMRYDTEVMDAQTSTEVVGASTGNSQDSQYQTTHDGVYIYTVSNGPAGQIELTSSTSGIEIDIIQIEGSDGHQVEVNIEVEAGASTSTTRAELAMLTSDPIDLAALDLAGNARVEDLTMNISAPYGISAQIAFDAMTGQMEATSQGFDFGMALEGMSITSDNRMTPIDVSIDRLNIEARAPFGPSHRIGTSAVKLDLENLRLSDQMMAMFDPSTALGRGPLNLHIDATGQTSGLVDLNNIEAFMQGPAPELRSFRFDVKGEFTDFNFTADGTGQMQDDMPIGTGQLSVTNLQSMLNRLSQAGLIAQHEAAMASGMIAGFFTPGPAPGSLRLSVDSRADGTIWVNGAQVQ